MKNLIIVGAGGFGRETLMTINEINEIKINQQLLEIYDATVISST